MAVFWVVAPCGLVGAPTFRRNILSPFSGWWLMHGVTTQKATIDSKTLQIKVAWLNNRRLFYHTCLISATVLEKSKAEINMNLTFRCKILKIIVFLDGNRQLNWRIQNKAECIHFSVVYIVNQRIFKHNEAIITVFFNNQNQINSEVRNRMFCHC